MVKKLMDEIWFGDWKSPMETIGQVKSIINVAHSFSSRRGRNIYWANLEKLPWNVLYFRLALRDRDTVTPEYMRAFADVVEAIKTANAFPVLCHCQMGGHRGPTAALHVAHLLGFELKETHKTLVRLSPGLLQPKRAEGRIYYPSTVKYLWKLCRDEETATHEPDRLEDMPSLK